MYNLSLCFQTISTFFRKFVDCQYSCQEICYSVPFDELEEKDFSLVQSKYIQFVNRDENIDFDGKMKRIQRE